MAHTNCTEPGTGKWVCNPLVPGPVPCPVRSLGGVWTVKGIIYKPIVPGPVPIPVQCECQNEP